jgi:hypothetical protein
VQITAVPIRKRVILAGLALAGLTGGLVWWATAAGRQEVQVRGRVTVGGTPLSGGLVIFYPDAARGNASPVEPRSLIDRQGRYRLSAEGRTDIAPGWYRVVVVPPQAEPGGKTAQSKTTAQQPKQPPRFDRRYENPDTSGLAVHVTPTPAEGAYDFKLDPQRGTK